jgi:hypothetical protein
MAADNQPRFRVDGFQLCLASALPNVVHRSRYPFPTEGTSMTAGRTCAWLVLWLVLGCDAPQLLMSPDEPEPWPEMSTAASRFDPADAGTVQGRVVWHGDWPDVKPVNFPVLQPGGFRWETKPAPNAPAIDPDTRAVRGAVVYLRGIAAEQSRPWDLPPVRVELRDMTIRVFQGTDGSHSVGFVRRGDAAEFVSHDPDYHALRARGSAFFTLPFPDPERPVRRTFFRRGLVELSSAAQYFWMRAYLFVDDHPYYAVTDAQGRFTLPQVPAGRFEVVAWLPNWNVARQERDPESGQIVRQFFAPPWTAAQTIGLPAGGTCETALTLGAR